MDDGRWGMDSVRLTPIVHRLSSMVHRQKSDFDKALRTSWWCPGYAKVAFEEVKVKSTDSIVVIEVGSRIVAWIPRRLSESVPQDGKVQAVYVVAVVGIACPLCACLEGGAASGDGYTTTVA